MKPNGKRLFLDLATLRENFNQYDYDGTQKVEIPLPGLGSISGLDGKENDQTLFYFFTSFTDPGSIYEYDIVAQKSNTFFQTELKFDPMDYVQKQVWYKSKDGTSVPMFIVHKKGIAMDGNNPECWKRNKMCLMISSRLQSF